MDEKPDVIRHEIEETRSSLAEKLETLEQKVTSTVTGATDGVAETVAAVKDSVQETVSTVKDTVQDTISAVKDTVQKGVESVKNAFDVVSHTQRHPMLMFAGSMAAGYVAGLVVARAFGSHHHRRRVSDFQASTPATPARPAFSSGNGNGRHETASRQEAASASASSAPGFLSSLLGRFGPEISRLKSLALGAIVHSVRQNIEKAVPEPMRPSLMGIIDSFSEKIGAETSPSANPFTQDTSKSGSTKGTHGTAGSSDFSQAHSH